MGITKKKNGKEIEDNMNTTCRHKHSNTPTTKETRENEE